MRRVRRCIAAGFSPVLLYAASYAIPIAYAQPPASNDPLAADTAPAEGVGAAKAEADPADAAPPPIEIPEGPLTVDPATLVPPKLAEKATVMFEEASLREVVEWLRDERKIVTLVDNRDSVAQAVANAEPITDRLQDEPIYLLLDRLHAIDLAWYCDDEILHFTTTSLAAERYVARTYNVGDLLDAGYEHDTLIDVVTSMIEPEEWPEFGGTGESSLRGWGDVLVISQTERRQREIRGLLTALREHGRMTYAYDPPQHERLREAMQKTVSVDFQELPLVDAMRNLSKQAGVEIRFDQKGLESAALTDDVEVSLALHEIKLATTLDLLLTDLDLTWLFRDGVIWITDRIGVEESLKPAAFDVRDLARDRYDSDVIVDALTSTIDPESWPEFGGTGSASIRMPLPGTLVISQTERNLDKIAALLENYRATNRLHPSRMRTNERDPQAIVTFYYRLPARMAEGLVTKLPELVQPETWRTEANPEAPGTILLVPSARQTVTADDDADRNGATSKNEKRATLVIRQTRETHEEIDQTIYRIETGDRRKHDPPLIMGWGMGGGWGGGLPVSSDDAPDMRRRSKVYGSFD